MRKKTEVAKKDKSGNVVTQQAVKNISNDNLKKDFNLQEENTDIRNKKYCIGVLSGDNNDCKCIPSSEGSYRFTLKDNLEQKRNFDDKIKITIPDSSKEPSGMDNK